MVIWQPDTPSIEDGVHSVWLAMEGVNFTDGWKPHVTMGIQNFIWITPTWAERQRTEHSKDRWLITHLVSCKITQHRWIVGKLLDGVIMSGVQTLVVKSDQDVLIVVVKNSVMRSVRC